MTRNHKEQKEDQSQNHRPPRKSEEAPGFGNKKLEGPDRPST